MATRGKEEIAYRERQENQADGERMRSGKVARVGLRVHHVFGEFAER